MSMITSYVEDSSTKRSLTLEVSLEEVKRATERTAREIGKQVRLPGFRPGKVPLEVIKKRFQKELKSEVLEHLLRDALSDAIQEKGLNLIGQPKVDELKFELDEPLSFKVEVEIRPAVNPKDYRGLKVPSDPTHATDDEIGKTIERIRESHASFDPIEDRPAMDGDFALVDLHGSFPGGDGKDFDAEKAMIEIGGEQTMPELTANLRNAEPGISFTFQKSFPAEMQDSEFAGKTVLYSGTLIALKKRVLPALDDDFARQALTPRDGETPEGADLAMLREKVGESIRRQKEDDLKEKRRRAVLDGLLALNHIDAPESMVEAEIDSALKNYARALARQGVDLKAAEIDWNEMRGAARETSVRRVKEYLLLDAIGEAEAVAVTDTELDAAIKRQAAAGGTSYSELKAALVKNDRLEGLREEMRIEKVLEFLVAEAVPAVLG